MSACSVLFALSDRDRQMFLAGVDLGGLPGAESTWVDPSGFSLEEWNRYLRMYRPDILVTKWGTPRIPDVFAQSADMPLRYVCHMAGGVRALVPRHLIERGVLVSNWGTSISHTIAEHAVLLILAALRNLSLWSSFQDMPADRYVTLRTQSLRGRRVGLHGFGGIARELVEMLKPFRVGMAAYSRGVPRGIIEAQGVKYCESMEELFSARDIIVECEALTPQSMGSVTVSPNAAEVNVIHAG
jgi:phosphoglycerate dehydrogenase-like enzyme